MLGAIECIQSGAAWGYLGLPRTPAEDGTTPSQIRCYLPLSGASLGYPGIQGYRLRQAVPDITSQKIHLPLTLRLGNKWCAADATL